MKNDPELSDKDLQVIGKPADQIRDLASKTSKNHDSIVIGVPQVESNSWIKKQTKNCTVSGGDHGLQALSAAEFFNERPKKIIPAPDPEEEEDIQDGGNNDGGNNYGGNNLAQERIVALEQIKKADHDPGYWENLHQQAQQYSEIPYTLEPRLEPHPDS